MVIWLVLIEASTSPFRSQMWMLVSVEALMMNLPAERKDRTTVRNSASVHHLGTDRISVRHCYCLRLVKYLWLSTPPPPFFLFTWMHDKDSRQGRRIKSKTVTQRDESLRSKLFHPNFDWTWNKHEVTSRSLKSWKFDYL